MSPEQQAPAFSGFNMEVPPPQVEQPKPPPPPPFSVKNRSRAQKLAKVLYGPMARVWINRSFNRKVAELEAGTKYQRDVGVCVGTEQGAIKRILTGGKDFSEALKAPTETYVKGATDYDETKKRFRAVTPFADVQEFVLDALKQFPEYQRDLEKSTEKFKKVLEKGAKQFADALKKQ